MATANEGWNSRDSTEWAEDPIHKDITENPPTPEESPSTEGGEDHQ